MKLKSLFAVVTLALSCSAFADPYVSLTYDQKDKQNSTQLNHVFGLNVGQKFSNGVGVEVRMEDEKVDPGAGATQKQEGLLQAKISYDISTGTMFTPYVAGAVGQKNKSTSDFPFWVGEVGVKAKLNDTFNMRYGYRQRTAFDTTANSYDTTEHTVALGMNITKKDALSIAYKQERGTSDYNTTGLYYTRSF